MNNDYQLYGEYSRISDIPVPQKFKRLISILQGMYGENLEIGSLMKISSKDFLSQGIKGQLNLKKFKGLKKYISKSVAPPAPRYEPTCDFSKPVTDVPPEYQKIYEKVKKLFPEVKTYWDLCVITMLEMRCEGMNKKEVDTLVEWQCILEGLRKKPAPKTRTALHVSRQLQKELSGYNIRASNLSPTERRLFARFVTTGTCYKDLTPTFILKTDPEELADRERFSTRAKNNITELQSRIMAALESNDDTGILIRNYRKEDLSATEAAALTAEDIVQFIDTLSKDQAYVWCGIYGYKTDPLSKVAMAGKLGVSGEAVRQKVNSMNHILAWSMHVPPTRLMKDLTQNSDKQWDEFTSLFHHRKTLNKLIKELIKARA